MRRAFRRTLALSLLTVLAGCNGLGALDRLTPHSGYARDTGVAYGADPRQRLDVYRPDPPPAGPAPLVMFLHGGRWSFGEPGQYRFVAQALTARGFIAVLPGYRLYPQVRFPEFAHDAAAALAWTCAHAAELGGDPRAVFVMGHSAGAHLAALVTLDPALREAAGACAPAGMIGLAGPYDFLPLKDADLQDMFGPPERHAASQPITYADHPGPPLLLLHGALDSTVRPRNSVHLARAARAASTDVTLLEYRLLNHGTILAALAAPLRGMSSVTDDISAFVRRHAGTRQ